MARRLEFRASLSGGQTITVKADLHQLSLFIRAGSGVELGDLNVEWNESRAIAERKPDLKRLDAELKQWFETRSTATKR
jgi:alpha-glucosidase (family GH31 glycosyl hydrolase)